MAMRPLGFGEELPSLGNMYLRVKQKGDQIQFRIAQSPVYSGKHFLSSFKDGKQNWDIQSCPRINEDGECALCSLFFQAKAEAKKIKDIDKEKAAQYEKEARAYACAITFYFPVLNRDTGKMGVLQTTAGVRKKLNDQHAAGIDVMAKDWILRNTGSEVPAEIYSLIPVDSADTKEFTEEEEAEFLKAQNYDLQQINDGATQTDEIDG